MRYLQKLALLILLGSLTKCTGADKDQNLSGNYSKNLIPLHTDLRARISLFTDSISYFGDTAEFFSRVHPILIANDKFIADHNKLVPPSRHDSLIFAASERLKNNYQTLLHRGYIDLFEIYNKGEISNEANQKAAEILNYYMKEDSLAVDYINFILSKEVKKLNYF